MRGDWVGGWGGVVGHARQRGIVWCVHQEKFNVGRIEEVDNDVRNNDSKKTQKRLIAWAQSHTQMFDILGRRNQ